MGHPRAMRLVHEFGSAELKLKVKCIPAPAASVLCYSYANMSKLEAVFSLEIKILSMDLHA